MPITAPKLVAHLVGTNGLLFKRLKQLLRVQPIRAKSQQAVEATIRALVVAWALQEQIAAEVRALLPTSSRDPHAPASSWLLATVGVETVRTIVRGSWTLARIRACLPLLVRLLVTSRRKRRQQESEVRAWLLSRFGRAHPLREAA